MLELVKRSLRITHDQLDEEIQLNIDTCLTDLRLAGVIHDSGRPIMRTAICLYCRWAYDYNGQADLYLKAYESLKIALSLTEDLETEVADSE